MKETNQVPGSLDQTNSVREEAGRGLSRRGFLKGAGLTTAGAVMLETGILGKELEPPARESIGPDGVAMTLSVNGQIRRFMAEPRTTLA